MPGHDLAQDVVLAHDDLREGIENALAPFPDLGDLHCSSPMRRTSSAIARSDGPRRSQRTCARLLQELSPAALLAQPNEPGPQHLLEVARAGDAVLHVLLQSHDHGRDLGLDGLPAARLVEGRRLGAFELLTKMVVDVDQDDGDEGRHREPQDSRPFIGIDSGIYGCRDQTQDGDEHEVAAQQPEPGALTVQGHDGLLSRGQP